MKKKKSSSDVRVVAEMVKTGYVKEETLQTSGRKKTSQKLIDEKRRKSGTARRDAEHVVPSHTNEIEDTATNRVVYTAGEPREEKLLKQRKKKRKNVESIHFDESNDKNDASEECVDSISEKHFSNSGRVNKGDATRNTKKGKSKNPEKKKKKRRLVSNQISSNNLLETRGENAEDEVYQMSSGYEDYSKGMKKWITHYHQSRPGLKVLQERIDDFIMSHEAREEQAKAERLAQAAEGGWTVVVHQKGRKKTTEAESGIAVGSVAQAAVLEKMGKKKKKEVGLDFYQFNRREAHRNEIMMLQSKFEQDKKRIQQMRAARKFRPY